MKYTLPRFTLPATEGKQENLAATCRDHGHMWADRKGKCVRCGAKIRHVGLQTDDTSSGATT